MIEAAMNNAKECVEHAEVLMMQAELTSGEARRDLLDQATDVLFRAERLLAGSGAWRIACIHARQGNRELCLRWLQRGRDLNTLPPVGEMRASAYFTEVRFKEWFREFVDSL
jgi:hypothetical protein